MGFLNVVSLNLTLLVLNEACGLSGHICVKIRGCLLYLIVSNDGRCCIMKVELSLRSSSVGFHKLNGDILKTLDHKTLTLSYNLWIHVDIKTPKSHTQVMGSLPGLFFNKTSLPPYKTITHCKKPLLDC